MRMQVDSPAFAGMYKLYNKARELSHWLPKRFQVVAMGQSDKGYYVENAHRRIYSNSTIERDEFNLELKRAAIAKKLMRLRDKRKWEYEYRSHTK